MPALLPPSPPRHPEPLTAAGREIENDFGWLRSLAHPDTVSYLEAENRYARERLDAHAETIADLSQELEALQRAVAISRFEVVERAGGAFRLAYTGSRLDSVLYQADVATARRTLWDGDARRILFDDVEVGTVSVSPDGGHLAVTVDTTGQARFTLEVYAAAGALRVPGIACVRSIVWSHDGRALYFTAERDAPRRGAAVYRLEIATGATALVYAEHDERRDVVIRGSQSGRFILINVMETLAAQRGAVEVRAIDRHGDPLSSFELHVRTAGYEISLDHHHSGDWYWLARDEHPNGRFVRAKEPPMHATGEELIPVRPGAVLESVALGSRFAAVESLVDGIVQVEAVELASGARSEFPATGIGATAVVGFSASGDALSLRRSSPEVPEHGVLWSPADASVIADEPPQVAGHRPEDFEVERRLVPVAGGAEVPCILVRRRGADRAAPTLLTGYGCYGSSRSPSLKFDTDHVALLRRGVTIALAQVRGGGQFGREWHDAARLDRKHTTFDDFVRVAEYLLETGVALPGRLAIRGRSAGGTLVGVAATQRPELFCAVSALVPFADVLHTQLDATMPWTVFERKEWGDPRHDVTVVDAISAYCPYMTVHAGPYPPLYVTAGLHDAEVPYWQPAKWVAAMRSTRHSSDDLLFETGWRSGHAGSRDPVRRAAETGRELAFLLSHLLDGFDDSAER